MKKQFKYKLRRAMFIYLPSILIMDSIFILALIKGGIYVL